MPGQDPGGEGGGKADVEAAQVELNIMTQAHKHTSTGSTKHHGTNCSVTSCEGTSLVATLALLVN